MTLEERIRADVEGRIRSGEWRPGDRIPFEHEFVAQYGCARATVGKALTSLARAGLIERRRKAGSFVAVPRVQSAALDIPDIGAVIAAQGEAYRFVLTARAIRPVDAADPDQQRLGASGTLLWLKGVHFAGDTPFAAEDRAISLATVPEAAKMGFDGLAPGGWLLGHVPWTHARHRISAMAAGSIWSARLKIAPNEACLAIERWTWKAAAGGEAPVTFARQVFPGRLYDLVADFAPAGPA
jgi:GntR family histidine utilization transcriptional repressor